MRALWGEGGEIGQTLSATIGPDVALVSAAITTPPSNIHPTIVVPVLVALGRGTPRAWRAALRLWLEKSKPGMMMEGRVRPLPRKEILSNAKYMKIHGNALVKVSDDSFAIRNIWNLQRCSSLMVTKLRTMPEAQDPCTENLPLNFTAKTFPDLADAHRIGHLFRVSLLRRRSGPFCTVNCRRVMYDIMILKDTDT